MDIWSRVVARIMVSSEIYKAYLFGIKFHSEILILIKILLNTKLTKID